MASIQALKGLSLQVLKFEGGCSRRVPMIPADFGDRMILALDIWLLPAIAAASSSYLVSLAWERIRPATAPSPLTEGFLALLSFMMGGICALYRESRFAPTLEGNVIIMFFAGATTTYFWLLLKQVSGVRRPPPDSIRQE